jgi:hypothetical protein
VSPADPGPAGRPRWHRRRRGARSAPRRRRWRTSPRFARPVRNLVAAGRAMRCWRLGLRALRGRAEWTLLYSTGCATRALSLGCGFTCSEAMYAAKPGRAAKLDRLGPAWLAVRGAHLRPAMAGISSQTPSIHGGGLVRAREAPHPKAGWPKDKEQCVLWIRRSSSGPWSGARVDTSARPWNRVGFVSAGVQWTLHAASQTCTTRQRPQERSSIARILGWRAGARPINWPIIRRPFTSRMGNSYRVPPRRGSRSRGAPSCRLLAAALGETDGFSVAQTAQGLRHGARCLDKRPVDMEAARGHVDPNTRLLPAFTNLESMQDAFCVQHAQVFPGGWLRDWGGRGMKISGRCALFLLCIRVFSPDSSLGCSYGFLCCM